MKASPQAQKELLKVQEADNELSQLDHAAKTLPQLAVLAELGTQSAELDKSVIEARGRLDDARTELSRVESDVEVVQARMSRDAARLQQTSSVKDVQALEGEIESLKKRQSDLEDIELTVMERVEELSALEQGLVTQREAVAASVAQAQAARDEALAGIVARREAVRAERESVVAGLPDDLVALYERQRSRYGIGAALLRGGVSGGSNMTLTVDDLNEIRRAAPDDVVLDPESNCILVRTDESGI
ncbi:zinc ribbon domain-containing protein [Compostimonas suwonensis]|uniref:CT398-like coiled coil hairpin domain-containing protein n=1 Tax=Compostimonas suwonensis TaxID=1048394 RepID=A0A2M9BBF8_9MICO|nr:hypothetical protein [Compostimonas suwonensis]PJJ55282.1 hypothetical protein CLV54_3171 [Compostimonas suwonensis]